MTTLSAPTPRVLLVDDEPNLRKVLGAILQQEGWEVLPAADGLSALERVRRAPSGTFDVVITDLRMPGLDGMGLLTELRREDPDLPVVVLTAHGTVDTAVQALKSGAFDYLEKPFDRAQIQQVVRRALDTRARTGASLGGRSAPVVDESEAAPAAQPDAGAGGSAATDPGPPERTPPIPPSAAPREPASVAASRPETRPEPPRTDAHPPRGEPTPAVHVTRDDDPSLLAGMVGRSHSIQQVREIIRTAAASPSTVLITGESGTGKELVARALHLGSDRRGKPFISVNCAAIPTTLVESELFGHERGAFTGAISSRAGRFELAHGGTLFLDEVSEIPLEMQVKLLRAVQESEFERVGGVKTLRVDVRLVAASNRDLEQDIKARRFRDDLYYRLNVVPIRLPPLRDRIEDLPLLLDHFRVRCNERLHKQVQRFADDALELLSRYRWPGNIRELENLVERMVLFASGETIHADALPETFQPEHDDLADDGDDGDAAVVRETPVAGEPGHAEPAGDEHGRLIRLPITMLGLDLKEAVRQGSRLVEETLIREALAQTDGNVTRSARLLGISRRSLQSKMKELGLREARDEG